ncbi:MAG TPA: hypothetical protein VGM05_33360 [Planctomycetaceae bacterium]|jgi:hypothetical protein
MDGSTLRNDGQNFPAADSGGQTPPVSTGDIGATSAGGVDANAAMQFAASKFRFKLTAGYLACGGLIVVGMGIVYLTRTAPGLRALNQSHSTNRPADPAGPDPVLYATSQGPTHTARRQPDDRSLTLDVYHDAGMPAHERRWSGTDMTRAANTLSAMTQTDVGKLPRLESPRSGPLFARMTSEENLDLLRNQSLPIDQRLPDALMFMQGSSAILKLYLASFHKDGTGSTELIEIYGAQLRLWVVISQILDAFIPTLDKNDRTYEVRMQGLEKFREGLEMAVAGTLQTLTERAAYNTAELKRLLGFMQQTYPVLLPGLPQGTRQEAIDRLQSFRKNPAMADLNAVLTTLVDQVEPLRERSLVPQREDQKMGTDRNKK